MLRVQSLYQDGLKIRWNIWTKLAATDYINALAWYLHKTKCYYIN